MSLDNLKKNIEENAEEEVKKIRDETNAKIAEINKNRDNEIRAIKNEIEKFIDEETKRLTAEYLSSTDLAVRNIIDEAKQKVIDVEYNSVKSKLADEISKNEKYSKIIKSAITEAESKFGKDNFTIIADNQYKKKIEKIFPNIKIKPGEKGFFIKSNDGKIKIDASIDTLIEAHSAEIKKKIYNTIFKSTLKENEQKSRDNKKIKTNKNKKSNKKVKSK